MPRPHPGWLVVASGALVGFSCWLPWLTTPGGHASAIGGTVGSIVLPARFGAGQLIVLLASTLIVAGAMTARGLSPRASSAAALVISLCITALTAWYYRLNVRPPMEAGYGFYVSASATALALAFCLWALVSSLAAASRSTVQSRP